MKKYLLLCLVVAAGICSSCSHRIGDLTIISNRNVEFEKKHVEIKRDVTGTSAKLRLFGFPIGFPNMEDAIDDAIRKQGSGEYLRNATVTFYSRWYLLFGINGIRVRGDLMGYDGQKTKDQIQAEEKQNKIDQKKSEQAEVVASFNIGDKVSWKNLTQQRLTGVITGKSNDAALIKTDSSEKIVKVTFDKLTKIAIE